MFRLTQWSSKRECMGKCTGVDSCVGLCSIAPNPWAFNQEALGGHTRVSTLTKKLANIQSSLCTVKDVSAFLDTVQDTRSAFLDTVQDTRSASPLLFHGTGSCQTRKLAHPGDEDDWRYSVLKSINCTPKEMQLLFAMLGTCKLEPEQKSTLHSWVCESHTHTHAKPTFKISFLFFRIYTCWAKTPLFGHSNCSILTVCCYERSFLITLCKLKQRLLLATKGDSEPNLRLRFWHCNSGRWLLKVCAHQTAQQRFDFSTHFLSIKVSKLVATLEGQPEPGLLVIAAMDGWNSLVNLTILTWLVQRSSLSKKVSRWCLETQEDALQCSNAVSVTWNTRGCWQWARFVCISPSGCTFYEEWMTNCLLW